GHRLGPRGTRALIAPAKGILDARRPAGGPGTLAGARVLRAAWRAKPPDRAELVPQHGLLEGRPRQPRRSLPGTDRPARRGRGAGSRRHRAGRRMWLRGTGWAVDRTVRTTQDLRPGHGAEQARSGAAGHG